MTNLRNPLLNFLKHAENAAKKDQPAQPPNQHAEAEATRLRSLIQPPIPTSSLPYKSLITPISSPFSTAWRAFRHTFRDLTLLSWEERFDPNKTIQKARAQILGIEPYLYAKPPRGMPLGLMVQEAGLCAGGAQDVTIVGDAEDGYVRNEFGLPGLEEPLGRLGVVGAAIFRDAEDGRKKAEAVEREGKEREDAERQRRGEGKTDKKKKRYRGPLFNCATGKPRPELYG